MRTLLLIFAFALTAVLAQAQDQAVFQRGDIVRVKSKTPDFDVKVIAVPGDKVTIDQSGIYVNAVAVPDSRQELAPGETVDIRSMLIPDGHYYVMGERRTMTEAGEDVSQHWGLHPVAELEKAQK